MLQYFTKSEVVWPSEARQSLVKNWILFLERWDNINSGKPVPCHLSYKKAFEVGVSERCRDGV